MFFNRRNIDTPKTIYITLKIIMTSRILTPILTARPQTDELGLLVQGVDELEPI